MMIDEYDYKDEEDTDDVKYAEREDWKLVQRYINDTKMTDEGKLNKIGLLAMINLQNDE